MKRIIALMVALMLAAMMFNIKVSATDISGGITSGGGGEGGNRSEYGNTLEAFLNALGDYINGDITIDDFLTVSNKIRTDVDNSVYDRLGGNYIEGITSGIVNAVDKFGDNAQYYISEWYEDFLKDYTDLAQIESPNNPDKQGYGAMAIGVFADNENTKRYYYCDYIVITPPQSINNPGYMRMHCPNATTTNSDGVKEVFYNNGYLQRTSFYGKEESDYYYIVSSSGLDYIFSFYGDIRYEDGTQAPTDDVFVDTEVLDFSDTSDDELEKLLEDLLNKLNLEMPDLSTMEGLLESIYNRLGTLDSDNDNALLNDVNVAIVSLMSSNDKNTQEIVNALLEIRDGLKNDGSSSDEESGETGDSGTTDGHPNHISGTLYNVKPLDKNWLNKLFTDKTELKVEYQGNKYYLESCGCLLLDDKYYSVDMNYDSYTQIDYDFSNEDITGDFDINGVPVSEIDFGSAFSGASPVALFSALDDTASSNQAFLDRVFDATQQNKLNGIVDMVEKGLDVSVPYDIMMQSVQSFEGIIFNVTEPKDLTITLFDKEIVLLSTRFFGSSDHSIVTGGIDRGGGGTGGNREELYVTNKTMRIVRDLTSVFIGIAWVLNMRRKVTNMI